MTHQVVPFAALQRVLKGLGFVKTLVPGSHVVFEHAPSDTVFGFRLYKPREKVSVGDLLGVRKILDERGVVERDTFDEMLRQPAT
jgi:hypothetical protein